jgi:hypothetical protein
MKSRTGTLLLLRLQPGCSLIWSHAAASVVQSQLCGEAVLSDRSAGRTQWCHTAGPASHDELCGALEARLWDRASKAGVRCASS